MDAPAFIPGPWSIERREDCPGYKLYDADGDLIDYLSETRWIDDRDDPDMIASLHLIAAAPDLFDGCNALLGLIQLVLNRDDLPDDVRVALGNSHRIIEAKAAVAKATAEQVQP